jgi:cytochrome c biogenesis protein
VRDYGPSIGFKLRQATGEAIEYVNYMYPVERDGRAFFLSGVRNSPAEEFAYLYIPADDNDSLQGFNDFLQALREPIQVEQAANAMVETTLSNLKSTDIQLGKNLHDSLITLVKMFVDGGFAEVRRFVETQLPEAERETLGPAYLSMLREILSRIYFSKLGVQAQQSVDPEQVTFLQDAIDAIGTLPSYGSPVFLSLSDFEQRQASGLQIARSPGKPVVYLGCALLTAGIFLLFYVPQRRFWAWVEKDQQGSAVILAGMSNRNPREFDSYFEQVTAFITQNDAGTLLNNRVHNRT